MGEVAKKFLQMTKKIQIGETLVFFSCQIFFKKLIWKQSPMFYPKFHQAAKDIERC
jgi:hypothetical protein